MRLRTKLVAWAVVMSLVIMIGFSTIPPVKAQAQFIIAQWDYDTNGYGEGIELVYVLENSTGVWEGVREPHFIFWYESTTIELNQTANTALQFQPCVTLNHTQRGLTENATAFAIMRTSIAFWNQGNLSFSQQNLTWNPTVFDQTPTTWSFSGIVTVPIILVAGEIYLVIFTYEIYEVA